MKPQYAKTFPTSEEIHTWCKALGITWNWWESRRMILKKLAKKRAEIYLKTEIL